MKYETVHTMTDYYAGPLKGIADFEGRPHLYAAEWNDAVSDSGTSTFVLRPVDEEAFRLAIEDWEIRRRWEAAFHAGRAKQETHPALPEDRSRYEELQRLMSDRLVIDPHRSFRVRGQFRNAHDSNWSGKGLSPLEVRWRRI